jgi:predicted PurR-regulated permease PerM
VTDEPTTPDAARRDDEPWLTPRRLASLTLVLVSAWGVLTVVRALRTVLVMLAVALFLSFAMEPAVQWMARRGMRRSLATALVFGGVVLVAVGLIASMVPLFLAQLTDLTRTVPSIVDALDADLLSRLPFGIDLTTTPGLQEELDALSNRLGDELRNVLLGAAGEVVTLGRTAIGLLFQLATIALVTFYLVADGPRARRALAGPLSPERQREMLAIWEIAVAKTGGYIYSRILLAAAAALAHAAFFLAIGLATPIPLAVWIGLTSAFIPVVGTYLGAVAAIAVAFVGSPLDALLVTAFAVAYQQLENYVLAPRIQSSTMDVHPAIAFVSVVIGATLLGAVGALLALPATAVIQAVLSTYVRRHELIDELSDVALPEYPHEQASATSGQPERPAAETRPETRRPQPADGPR